MDFKKLEYILKVAQLGNITKAANELYMTQPALSHYISKVEKEEGVKIFDRSTNPIALTYAGERYIKTIKDILELNYQLEEEMREMSFHKRGRLTIGIPPSRAASLLPKVIPEFVQAYPGVQIRTVEHNSRQLKEDVTKGTVDFAILPQLEDFEEFRCLEMFDEELFLIAREGTIREDAWHMTVDGKKVIDIRQLKKDKFILLKNGHGVRNALDVLFKMNGFKPEIFMETTNNETAFGLAAAGLGIAIVPQMNIEMFKVNHPIEIYKVSEDGLKWTVSAIFNDNKNAGYLALAFVGMIRDIFA